MSTLRHHTANQQDNMPINYRVVSNGIRISMNWLEEEATRLYKRGRKGDRAKAARLRRQAQDFFNYGAAGHDLRVSQ